jgi:hypothetical protein
MLTVCSPGHQGKPLALNYSKAIMSMLPKTTYTPGEPVTPHEPVNDLTVHRYTLQQLFHPTAESRRFTREDAAKVFHQHLLSADDRVPNPELVQKERDLLTGLSEEESRAKFMDSATASEKMLVDRAKRKAAEEERKTKRVQNGRFEWRFKDINADMVGAGGRGRKGVGWRYGVQSLRRCLRRTLYEV